MGCVQSDTAGSKEERRTAAQIDADLRSDNRRKAPELRLLLLGTRTKNEMDGSMKRINDNEANGKRFSERLTVFLDFLGSGESGKSTIAKVCDYRDVCHVDKR